jgi:hypothetical protein
MTHAIRVHEGYDREGSAHEALRAGKAVAMYCGFDNARKLAAEVARDLPHDVWYTERNGDPITLVVPAGTPAERLPRRAQGYIIFGWESPEYPTSGEQVSMMGLPEDPCDHEPSQCRRDDCVQSGECKRATA